MEYRMKETKANMGRAILLSIEYVKAGMKYSIPLKVQYIERKGGLKNEPLQNLLPKDSI